MATVQVTKGIVRVAASATALGGQGTIAVHTPTGQVQTRGGIIRVMVDAPVGSTDHMPVGEARPYRASFGLSMMVAAVSMRGEIIQVEEGIAEILGAGPGGKTLTVKSGQSVTMQSGQAGSIAGLVSQGGLRAGVLASASHSSTPKEGLEHLVALQVNQATALGKALTGAAETGGEDSTNKDQGKNTINGATGGVTLASISLSNLVNPGPPRGAAGGPTATAGAGTAVLDPSNDSSLNIAFADGTSPASRGVSKTTSVSVPGGGGLLLFQDSNVTLDGTALSNNNSTQVERSRTSTELLLVDGGNLSLASHQGLPPKIPMIIRGLHARSDANDFGRNTFLNVGEVGATVYIPDSAIGTNTPADFVQQWAYSPVVPQPPLTDGGFGVKKRVFLVDTLKIYELLDQGNSTEGIDGVIRARTGIGGTAVTLAGGAVLSNTALIATQTDAISRYFTLKNDITGSVASIIGRNVRDVEFFDNTAIDASTDPGGVTVPGTDNIVDGVLETPGTGLNPAIVKIKDRVLAVVNGSSIAPASGARVSLVTILDGQLTGPSSTDLPTQYGRTDVPPLIEVIGPGSSTTSQSAFVVRASNLGGVTQLDKALLVASAPLISIIQGQMTTTGQLLSIEGNGTAGSARLAANVPNDQLLLAALQLNGSHLTVGGHLVNLSGGATASVTGNLVALANGSRLNIGGALINVGAGSSFSLNGGSLIAFGFGTNTVNITGGTCAGCILHTNIPNLVGIPVMLAPSAQIVVDPGFITFAGIGAGTQPQVFENQVHLPTLAGALVVGQDATLTLGR